MFPITVHLQPFFQDGGEGGLLAFLTSGVGLVLSLGLMILFIIGLWRTFVKAGQPGWGALIPIYNVYLLLRIAGRPGWWLILLLVPLVNIVILAIVCLDIAASFGKSAVFGLVLLFLLSGLGFLILGFGDAQYQGPAAAKGGRGA
ncbi:MAG: DUF5684 domain-containing protein [Caldilineales bacterium]|nr:DUF5684 domain-containing protein [Caldilineales bacterium]